MGEASGSGVDLDDHRPPTAYPDPTETGVFWIQLLIRELHETGNVSAGEFAPYLRGAR